MEAHLKPAIAGIHLEFADGIKAFPSVPGNRIRPLRNDDARRDKPRVPACTPCSLRRRPRWNLTTNSEMPSARTCFTSVRVSGKKSVRTY